MYALLLGGICIGFAPVLVRLADIGPVASAFWRLALAAPVLWLMAWWWARRAPDPRSSSAGAESAVPPESWLSAPLLLAGLFFAADLGTWHFSIGLTTIANATLLPNCAPLFVTLYAVLVERRSPPRQYFLALALALGGAVALTSPGLRLGASSWRGDALALLAAVYYTGYMLAVKRASRRHDTLRLMAVSTTISALALYPVAWWLSQRAGQPFWPGNARGWWVVVALALLSQVAGQGLIALALSRLSVALSSTGLLIQPVVAAAAAWLWFDERLSAGQVAGALVLMLGIWLARRSEA